MTQPEIEPQSPGPLDNTLLIDIVGNGNNNDKLAIILKIVNFLLLLT